MSHSSQGSPIQRSGLACAGQEQALGLEGSDDDPHRSGKGELQPPLNGGKEAGGEGQGRGRFSLQELQQEGRRKERGRKRKPGLLHQAAGTPVI